MRPGTVEQWLEAVVIGIVVGLGVVGFLTLLRDILL